MARKPANNSDRTVFASISARGRSVSSIRMSSRKSVEITMRPAVIANTTPLLATAMKMPASAGPMKNARLSTPLATAFAAVSSLGLRARVGVSAACADRKGVLTIVAAIART